LFFILVFFTMVGTLAQDVLLEPYGALVLNMPVGETTRLTQFWGIGVLISMLISGAILIKWLGHLQVLRIGIVTSILVFIGIIIAGISGNIGLFNSLVLVMGLGTGLAGAGMLAGIVNFTTTLRAGLLMGVWGMANQIGHAFGSLMGGGVVDLVRSFTNGNAFASYATVFALEAGMLVVAFILTARLDVRASHVQVEEVSKLHGSGAKAVA
jgi:MFS family permease